MPLPDLDALPLRRGSRGEAVGDVQRRLADVGHPVGDDPTGEFGPGTEAATRSFQEQRGLPTDGICGPLTWGVLVEAGYRLGDRFLYHRTPMLRGDDVAELQADLGALGFDAGRVDGIFGPDTARALEEFQRNSGLTPDRICGPDAVAALRRLAKRLDPRSIAETREVLAQRDAPRRLDDCRIVLGDPGSLDAVADRVQALLGEAGARVTLLHTADGSAQARQANDLAAELYVGLRLVPEPGCRVAYYATDRFVSVGGRRLAELAATELGTVLDQRPAAVGMRLPVLRETRMPAIVCELGPADEVVVRVAEVASALGAAVTGWVQRRLDE